MHADLFPQTMLAEISRPNFGERDSVSLSNFGLPESYGRLNFAPSSYTDKRGKTYSEYRLSRKGFSLLAMGFTGREALVWKVKFLDAFDSMESELHRLQGAKASALDMLRPNLQAIIDGERIGANRALVARYLGKSMGAVSYHRCVARRLGLIGQRQGGAE